ncbi:MAG: tRNA (adenosine(37)-N6)-dimethylallyltransferase MiaA [Patescibacteria group bacterium]
MKNNLPKLIVVLGPTASGKTELAIKLASKIKGEIVSADSRQIYRKMNIGTAKATKKEQEIIPHHLIDIRNPDRGFNVAVYKKLALKAIKKIHKKGKIPFLVGGTGLYIKSIVENMNFPRIRADKKLRESLESKTEEELFKIYKKLDAEGVKFIDKKNKRRLIRAIEVSKITKKPFWQQRKRGKPLFEFMIIGIKLPKEKLRKRIEKRVEKMFKLGLEKEVRTLVKKYSWLPILQTIGYIEWRDYFENKIKGNEIKEKIKLHTFQFAKRQLTWFERDNSIKWIKNQIEAENLTKQFLSKNNS